MGADLPDCLASAIMAMCTTRPSVAPSSPTSGASHVIPGRQAVQKPSESCLARKLTRSFRVKMLVDEAFDVRPEGWDLAAIGNHVEGVLRQAHPELTDEALKAISAL